MKLPSYIRQTKFNTYVFRRRIPKHLLQFFTTEEIRISLSRITRSVAIMNSRVLAFEAENLFYRLENNLDISETPSTLMHILRHKKELIAKDERYEELESKFFNFVGEQIKHRKMLYERHRSEISVLSNIIESRLEKPAKTLKKRILLSEAIVLYFDPNEVEDRADKLATIRKDKDSLKLFMEIIGDKDVSTIDKADAVEFKNKIALHGRKVEGKRAPSTINGYMNSISKFSGWLEANHSKAGHVKLDFSKLRRKKTKRPSEERDAFTIDEVLQILTHSKMSEFKTTDPAKYWLPFIAAYSGARLEEIAQLNPNTDIYQEDGIWIFNLNENDGKSLKNGSSTRKIPIHSKLIEIGILDFVACLKEKGSITLFPEEKARDGRVGKNAGKRVNRFIQEVLGIKNKSLHSFRHSFATSLKRSTVDVLIAAALMGHKYGDITYERYGKDCLVTTLVPAIELIKYV